MFSFKPILVESLLGCPNCGTPLSKGDIMHEDKDRGETVCGYCISDYMEDVIREEGEDGRLLK